MIDLAQLYFGAVLFIDDLFEGFQDLRSNFHPLLFHPPDPVIQFFSVLEDRSLHSGKEILNILLHRLFNIWRHILHFPSIFFIGLPVSNSGPCAFFVHRPGFILQFRVLNINVLAFAVLELKVIRQPYSES